MTALPDTVIQTGAVTVPNPVPVPIPVDLSVAVAAAAEFAGRAEGAAVTATETAASLAAGVASSAAAAAASATTATTKAGEASESAGAAADSAASASTSATTATTQATAASTSASSAATDRALVQSAMASIAAVSVPALPWLIDGLPPSVLLLAGSGAMMLDGGYVDVTDILTFSSAAKWVEGCDGTLYLSPANSPAYNWRTIDGVRVREILIEAGGGWNHWTYSEDATQWGLNNATVSVAANALMGSLALATVTATGTGQSIAVYRGAVAVSAGSTVTVSVAMVAGTRADAYLGVYGSTVPWGATGDSSAAIESGPGTVTRVTGSAHRVTGLSTTVPTIVSVTRTFTGTEYASMWLAAANGDSVTGQTVKMGRAQVELGAVATSYIPTTTAPAPRIPDDVRFTSAALAQAATETGATIVISGSAYGPDWVVGGAVGGAILVSSGSYRPGDYGELVTPIGWTPPFEDGFVVALACAPASRRASCDGGAVASSGVSSAWSLATETSIRLGDATWGGSATKQIYLRALRIHPYIASDAGLQAASEV